jgi:type VI secretion system protein ImpL
LLSNGEKLIDALSGSLAGWTSLLLDWKDRGVLTPEPPAHWGLREKALASQFVVLPATTQGLFALGDYFELPSQPDTSGLARTSADQAPPQPDDPRGIEALRNYLDDPTFRWLAACAIYPELHWDLTLYLGSLPCFSPGLVTEQNLLKLVRLPWFRRGSIPDELRWALIQELGQDREKAVREAIVDLLEKNPAPKETYASDVQQLEILFQRYWLDRHNSKKRGELFRALQSTPHEEMVENYTLLRSVESLSKSRLDIVLPARLRKILFPSGIPALGLRGRVLLALLLGLLLIYTSGLIVSFVKNRDLESQVVNALEGMPNVQLTAQQLPSLNALNQLETLRQSLETLTRYEKEGVPITMRLSIYVGVALYSDAWKAYFQHFRTLLFAQTQTALLQTLLSLPAAPGPNDQYGLAYDTLKAYLIITSYYPKSTRLFLSPVLLKAWAAGRDIDPDRMQLAQKQFDFYSDQIKVVNPYLSEYDTLAVARARNYLSQFSGIERVYRFMLAEASKSTPSINFNREFPGSAEVVVDGKEVDGAFTKAGWVFMQDGFKNLPKYFSGEQWVSGPKTAQNLDTAKLAQDLQVRYQQDYINQWRAFLKSANVVHYSSLQDAAQKLAKTSSNQSPLLALFCLAAQNTSVDQPDIAEAFEPVQAVVPPNCQEQYIGQPNANYVRNLSGIQACLDQVNNAPAEQKEAAKTQCTVSSMTAQLAARLIGQAFKPDREAHVDDTVQNLLLAPIVYVSGALRPGPVSGAGLCAQLNPLMAKFPFNPKSTQDATTQEVAQVFDSSSGVLAQFYNASLKSLLLPQGNEYIPNPSSTQPVSPAFLNFFTRAMNLQRALYWGGPGQIHYKYALRPHPTDTVAGLTMSIDGQPLTYAGGNADFKQFTWPGTTAQGVTLTVKITGGSDLGFPSYDGAWGVFHFFADADKWQQTGSTYNIEWVLRLAGGRPVTAPSGKPVTVQFDLDTLGAPPILQMGYLSSLQCVSSVAR